MRGKGGRRRRLRAAQRRVPLGGGGLVEHAGHARHLHRKADDPLAVRPSFRGVGVEEVVAGLPSQREVELPGEVCGIADPGAEALAHERRHEVGGVAGQEHTTVAHRLCQQGAELVDRIAGELRVVRAEPGGQQLPHARRVVEVRGALIG